MKAQELISRGVEFLAGEYRGHSEVREMRGNSKSSGKPYDLQTVVHFLEVAGGVSVHVEQVFPGGEKLPVQPKKGDKVLVVIGKKEPRAGVIRRSTDAIYPHEG